MYWQEHLTRWKEHAKDYPTKALLQVALRVHQVQQERIALQKGKLDGMMWSPRDWGK